MVTLIFLLLCLAGLNPIVWNSQPTAAPCLSCVLYVVALVFLRNEAQFSIGIVFDEMAKRENSTHMLEYSDSKGEGATSSSTKSNGKFKVAVVDVVSADGQ